VIAGFFVDPLSTQSYTVRGDTVNLSVFMTVLFQDSINTLKKYRHKAGGDMALTDVKIKAAKVQTGKKTGQAGR